MRLSDIAQLILLETGVPVLNLGENDLVRRLYREIEQREHGKEALERRVTALEEALDFVQRDTAEYDVGIKHILDKGAAPLEKEPNNAVENAHNMKITWQSE